MPIILGSIHFDEEVLIRQLERDLMDDWFPDARKFKDIFEKKVIQNLISKNIQQNSGTYKAYDRIVLNVPKANFTLRYGLETSILDRALYHGLTIYLIPFYDPLLPWSVFSHRYNSDYKSDKYLFKRGVKAWCDFVGNVKAATEPGDVLLSTDLTNYFDNIEIPLLKNVLIDLIPVLEAHADEKILIRECIDSLFECLRNWSYSENHGLPQNRDASSFLANIYMLAIDKHMIAGKYKYFRYMDDIKIVCSDIYSARQALKELSLELRKFGLSVNSGKTTITKAEETDEINKQLDAGGVELQQIDSIWQTRSLTFISRSFPMLQEYTLRLLHEHKSDSREFRFCIKRLEILAHCQEFEVPEEYFSPITPLIVDLIPEFPAATDQLVKYLLAVPTSLSELERISSYLKDECKSFYSWQNYKLWLLLIYKEYIEDELIEFAKHIVETFPDNPTRCGATLYLGALGGKDERILIAENFKSIDSFFGQRSALVAVQELHYNPYIKELVQPYLRSDLQTVYLNLGRAGIYIAPLEKTLISSIIDDERAS